MIKRLIKLHVTLFKYLIAGLKKAKTPKDKLKFVITTGKAYFIAIKHEGKQFILLFNVDYRKKKVEFEKQQAVQKDLANAVKLLNYLDKKLDKKGYNRQQKKQFWQDFRKNQTIRNDVFKELTNEISNYR